MATTSPDNLRTPDPGDPYNLVPDLQILASDTQAALVSTRSNLEMRANSYIGTAAQMNATAAPDGTTWWNTTTNSRYDRIGGAWVVYESISVQSLGGFTGAVRCKRVGKVVEVQVSITSGAAGAGASFNLVTIPAEFRPPNYSRPLVVNQYNDQLGRIEVSPAGVVSYKNITSTTSNGLIAQGSWIL